MNQLEQWNPPVYRVSTRNVLLTTFYHFRLIAITFLLILLASIVYVLLLPDQYAAQMKILLNRERADPVATADHVSVSRRANYVTLEELNSELELLKSRDLLKDVVVSTGLHQLDSSTQSKWEVFRSWLGFSAPNKLGEGPRTARAVARLERNLQAKAVRDSNLITVSYNSEDPERSASVLNKLGDLYLEKRLDVRRPKGTFTFFQQEAETYRKELAEAEQRLAELSEKHGLISVRADRENILQQISQLEPKLQATRAEIAVAEKRISVLEGQFETVPERLTTQVRTSTRLLEDLEGTLMKLQLKRTELLAKYQPDYPLVQEVEQQIAQTRAAIEKLKANPATEQTTDRNPTYQWVNAELAKARSDSASLWARATAMAKTLTEARQKARRLEQLEQQYRQLEREAKVAEQNYLTYLEKQEQARIADALDGRRISNVVIAEPATPPFFPSGPSRGLLIALGVLVAGLVSTGLIFLIENWHPSFRTPDQVEACLGIPVLAAIPLQSEGGVRYKPEPS